MITTGKTRDLVERVRQRLAPHAARLVVRANGPHVVIAEGAAPLARLTPLGPEAFGLSFPQDGGRWDMLLVDALDDVVDDVLVALAA